MSSSQLLNFLGIHSVSDFRRWAAAGHHPDKGGCPEKFATVSAEVDAYLKSTDETKDDTPATNEPEVAFMQEVIDHLHDSDRQRPPGCCKYMVKNRFTTSLVKDEFVQCRRKATTGSEFCTQHTKMAAAKAASPPL